MTDIITRAQWSARRPRYVNRAAMRAKSTGHWNGPAVKVGNSFTWDHSRCAALVRGIQNFHMDGRGWSDIAYNFVVCPHDYIFEGRGLDVINGGNGTNSGNRTSHAIMVLAGVGNPHPEEEKRAFRYCVDYIRKQKGTPAGAIGHRDHKATECPGDARYKWIHAGMPVTGQREDDDMMFREGTDLNALVRDSYEKVVGRKPESDLVRGAWAWTIAVEQGGGYSKLMNGLHYEQRLRQEAQLRELTNRIARAEKIEPGDIIELSAEVEERILSMVYDDLVNKIS